MNALLKLTILLLASSCVVTQSLEQTQNRKFGLSEGVAEIEDGLFSVGEDAIEAVEDVIGGAFRSLLMATGAMSKEDAKKAKAAAKKAKNAAKKAKRKANFKKALAKAKKKCGRQCAAEAEKKTCYTKCVGDAKAELRKKYDIQPKSAKSGSASTLGDNGGYGSPPGAYGLYGYGGYGYGYGYGYGDNADTLGAPVSSPPSYR